MLLIFILKSEGPQGAWNKQLLNFIKKHQAKND